MTQGQPFPLCHPQRRVWYSEILHPGTGVGNLAGCLHLPGTPADLPRLEAAIDRVVRRHDALRIRLVPTDAPVCAQVLGEPEGVGELPVWEVDGDRTLLHEMSRRPLPLFHRPLHQLALVVLPDDRVGFFFKYHHIVVDALSVSLLNQEILGAFQGAPDPAPAPSYLEFFEREARYLASEECRQEEVFWQGHLEGLALPPRVHEAIQTRRYEHTFSPELSAAVEALARSQGATVFRFFLALFAAHFGGPALDRDVVLGTGHHNRLDEREKSMVGMTVSTLPLRLPVRPDDSFRSLLSWVQPLSTEGLARQRYPFDLLARHLRERGGEPLGLLRWFVNHIPGATGKSCVVERYSPGADLAELNIKINPNQWPRTAPLQLGVDARLCRHDAEAMALFFQRVEDLARRVVRDPDAPLRAPTRPTPLDPGLELFPARFSASVARYPERVALVDEQGSLTWRELGDRVRRLAAALVARGVGPGRRVAVSCGRNRSYVEAVLGVLQAGGAWVPLLPDSPAPRRQQILEDAGPHLVLSDVPRDWEVPVEGVADLASQEAAPVSFPDPDPEDEAYVLYTSGSTGIPKGVRVPHRALANLVDWNARLCGMEPQDRAAAFCSFAFDVSVAEMLVPLSVGAAVVVVPQEVREDVHALSRFLTRQGVTVASMPTRVGELFAALPEPPPSLRVLIVGGEKLGPCGKPPFRLINGYGPTETAVYATTHEVEGGEGDVPIGRPVPGLQARVLDDDGRPVPPGQEGELWLVGVQVALGYTGDPSRTLRSFVPDPLGSGRVAYRTGDRVVARPDGVLLFRGRRDRQVKRRGFRVEPRELERVLVDHPGVEQAVALARGDTLVAWVTGTASLSELERRAREHLPDWLRPDAIHAVSHIPYSPNGKVDGDALWGTVQPTGAGAAAPRNGGETTLLGLFHQVLGRRDLGIHDPFFASGGDSLKAMQLFARIGQDPAWGAAPPPVGLLFQHPTVADLALALQSRLLGEDHTLPLVRRGGPGVLFCVHDFSTDILPYRALVDHLDPSWTVRGVLWSWDQAAGATTLPDLAARYVTRLRALEPRGPYHLLGYSIGGTLAFEMARQLAAAGERVDFLGLLDTPNYAADGTFLQSMVRTAIRVGLAWFRGMSLAYKVAWITRAVGPVPRWSRIRDLLRAQGVLRRMGLGYTPGPYDGPVLLVRGRGRRATLGEDLGWASLVPHLQVAQVDADHVTLMGEAAAPALAQAIHSLLPKRS